MNRYDTGNLVRLSAVFTDSSKAYIDPSAVMVDVTPPNNPKVVYTYGVDTDLHKEDMGKYHIEIPVEFVGIWKYKWRSTGIGQAASSNSFEVK